MGEDRQPIAVKFGWGILACAFANDHWRRTLKTLFGAQGLLIPESSSLSYGEYVNPLKIRPILTHWRDPIFFAPTLLL